MASGWIRIDRGLFDHWLWEDKPFSKGQAWIDLIGLANYKDGQSKYMGETVDCQRGTVNRSITFLAKRWGWSRKKTRTYLGLLEGNNMVTTKVSTHNTVITLVNYGKFNDSTTDRVSTKGTTKEQQKNSKGTKERIKENKGNKLKENIASPFEGIDPDDMDDETYYKWQKWRVDNGLI